MDGAGPSVRISYSVSLPEGSQPPRSGPDAWSAPLPSTSSLSTPIQLALSQTPGSPHSSRETEKEYLQALVRAVEEAKEQLMPRMTAWKDSVGKFEDVQAKRLDSGAPRKNKAATGPSTPAMHGANDAEDETSDEQDDESEDE